MEKILVGIDGQKSAWEALTRACALARRIEAQLYVLLVFMPAAANHLFEQSEVRRTLALRIESAKSEGININYYITEGCYEEEIIRFVNQYRITLLVWEMKDGEQKAYEREARALQAIRHRLTCKVEIVAPRKKSIKRRREYL